MDNRTRLDFHGERRIWDGRLIKQLARGNSPLYIYIDEVFQLICFLRADVSKYRPEVYKSEKSKILKKIHKEALGKLLA